MYAYLSSVPVLAGTYIGVLDLLSTPLPTACFSFRLLTGTYAGKCINVRRDSDNTTMDIGFVSGVLDTATLLSFCGTANGFIVTKYNQGAGGSANNVTNATATYQPHIVNAGVLVTATNGLAAASYSASGNYLINNNPFMLAAGSASVNAVVAINYNTNLNPMIVGESNTTNNNLLYWYAQGAQSGSVNEPAVLFRNEAGTYVLSNTTSLNSTYTFGSTTAPCITTWIDSGSSVVAYVNGYGKPNLTSYSRTGVFASTNFSIGGAIRTASPGNFEQMLFQEIICWGGINLSTTDRNTLERNQASYYSITYNAATVGSAAGVASVNAAASAITNSTGASSGAATVTAASVAVFNSTGVSSGVATANAATIITFNSTGAAIGAAVVNANAYLLAPVVGNISGAGVASGVGVAKFNSIGSVSSVATVNASARLIAPSIGNSSGSATVAGVGVGINFTVGSAAGLAAVNAAGKALFNSVGNAAGAATAQGQLVYYANATGQAQGAATAQAISNSIFKSVGLAAGVGAANGFATAFSTTVGNAAGVAVVTGVPADQTVFTIFDVELGSIESRTGYFPGEKSFALNESFEANGLQSSPTNLFGVSAAIEGVLFAPDNGLIAHVNNTNSIIATAPPSGNFHTETTAPLLANNSFIGASKSLPTNYTAFYFYVTVYTDQSSAINGFQIQAWNGTAFITIAQASVAANTPQTLQVPLMFSSYRVVYSNGGTNQTELTIQSVFAN